ncbi:MAG: cytochrome C oxidase subunit IV [Crocinitomicaceae bacterium]|jgi:cytochrome c oxidase subunit IV|nr:cytochrome C oxidase subunit IV [Crocinitomicaceae bacterium]
MIRDDLYKDAEYAKSANHDEEHGREIRKKITKVTIILTLITILEVGVGIVLTRPMLGGESWSWFGIKMFYIILTVVKAAYIVLVFMHLGDERKNFRWVILAPYILFILYLLFICITESTYILDVMRAPW